jgi:hypothetical protein
MASGVPTPREGPDPAPVLKDATTDLTSSLTPDVEDPTQQPLTTDHPAEGTASEAQIEVPQNVEFPTLTLGVAPGTPAAVLSMRNAGTNPLRVAGMSFIENPGQAFTMRSGCARHPIPAGEQCLVQVFFHPPTAGTYRGLLAIDAEGLERQTVAVSGTAKEPDREPPEEPAAEPPKKPEQPVIAPVPVLGWCCTGGEVRQSTENDCKEEKGGFFRGQRQATAACLIVGCCVDGAFKLGETRERCDELGGVFMSAVEVPRRCRAG